MTEVVIYRRLRSPLRSDGPTNPQRRQRNPDCPEGKDEGEPPSWDGRAPDAGKPHGDPQRPSSLSRRVVNKRTRERGNARSQKHESPSRTRWREGPRGIPHLRVARIILLTSAISDPFPLSVAGHILVPAFARCKQSN
jgi:hypothetical protein